MSVQFQASLVEAAQTTTPALTGLAGTRRTPLSAGAWIDIRPNWVSGADDVFAALVDDVPWRAEQRQMWDKVVDVPRLRSEEHTSELTSLMRLSYAVFCLTKNKPLKQHQSST